MRPLLAASGLLFAACATTGGLPTDRESTPSTRVKLDFANAADVAAHPVFPAAIDPRLPSADRIAPRIHHLLGDVASAQVALCVAPSGKVASVALGASSGMPAFDRAMMNDISTWQFAAMPGPASVKACEQLTISYRPHD